MSENTVHDVVAPSEGEFLQMVVRFELATCQQGTIWNTSGCLALEFCLAKRGERGIVPVASRISPRAYGVPLGSPR